jgi:Flp pilus assembly protein TadG
MTPDRQPSRARASVLGDGSRRRDDGAITILVLLLTPMLLALAGLVWDGGLAINARQQAADLAEQAARAGADQLDLDAARADGTNLIDTARARTAACHYLLIAAPAARCAATATAQQVTVRVTTTTTTALLGLIGLHSLTTHGQATARPVQGVLTGTSP